MTDARVIELLDGGRFDEALALATERLKAARTTGDDAGLAAALVDEARAQLAHGDRDDAVMTVDEAISKARRASGPSDPGYADALELGAEIAAAAGMPNAADARFRAAVEVLERAGVTGAPLVKALFHHGLFRLDQGDMEAAARALSRVVELGTGAKGAERYAAMALTEMGFAVLAAGQDGEARALGDRALEILLALGKARRFEVADGMTVVGIAALGQGEPRVAADFLEPACEIYRGCKTDVRARHALALRHYGLALAALGKVDVARAALRGAIGLYREGSAERLSIEQDLLDLARIN